jgi:hypothetical protein
MVPAIVAPIDSKLLLMDTDYGWSILPLLILIHMDEVLCYN